MGRMGAPRVCYKNVTRKRDDTFNDVGDCYSFPRWSIDLCGPLRKVKPSQWKTGVTAV